ncbi:MAG TPA: GNAT family N-acetyltransferase [Roseateles sp.]|nr:GNAT family N-acetyltransferase [Roseateles sp.]
MNTTADAIPSLARERPDQPEVRALIEALDAFQRALYPAASNHLLDPDALLRPDIRFLVVRDASRRVVLGCGAIRLREDCAELKRMMVRPEARGRGLGQALVGALEVEAVMAGRPLLRLETGVRQRPAIRLYERTGFRRCGPFADYRPDPFSVYMEKLLGA